MIFSNKDLEQLNSMGISLATANQQIKNFETGFPYAKLVLPAIVGNGIIRMDSSLLDTYVKIYEKGSMALSITKFVPASGAATRMFKDQFAWIGKLKNGLPPSELIENDSDARKFFSNITKFAFWEDLSKTLMSKGIDASDYKADDTSLVILQHLLEDIGLGYASLPKGLLKFHKYSDNTRTSTEEHLVEGINYACDGTNKVKIHLTVSPEHKEKFIAHLANVIEGYEKEYGVNFEIKLSVQKPSTDTLAVNPDNTPFRNADGTLLLRPGGHGALIQNLNELKQDIVFIKNIDNVVPDRLKPATTTYKKALGGLLIYVKQRIDATLRGIEHNSIEESQFEELKIFLKQYNIIDIDYLPTDFAQAKLYLREALNRPIRVCGMVKNTGEPGGGPFWVKSEKTGQISLQIVESSQVEMSNADQKAIFNKATHFNPVDLVCAAIDFRGEPFDLTRFVDHTTGFISLKSQGGKDLKAQELPGLWNGAMAEWITMFVEVPVETFNPVKTIMDLIRDQHL